MIVKVCGIKYQDNLDTIARERISMIGFNFYPLSKRFIKKQLNTREVKASKVGVFVNAKTEDVKSYAISYNLEYLQFHGDENIAYIKQFNKDYKIIKVISISSIDDLKKTEVFEGLVNLFLFDTKDIDYGGSGRKFDWEILNQYQGNTPFLLAGGIGPEDYEEINKINHFAFAGIDINSRFESEPGYKNIDKINSFLQKLNT